MLISTNAQSYKAHIGSFPPGGITSTENKSGGINPHASCMLFAFALSSDLTGEDLMIMLCIIFHRYCAELFSGPNKNSKPKDNPLSFELLYVFA